MRHHLYLNCSFGYGRVISAVLQYLMSVTADAQEIHVHLHISECHGPTCAQWWSAHVVAPVRLDEITAQFDCSD